MRINAIKDNKNKVTLQYRWHHWTGLIVYVLGVSILPVYPIFKWDVRNDLTVWYISLFHRIVFLLNVKVINKQTYYLYNNIVLSMLYAEICPKVRRHNARPEEECIMPSNLVDIYRHITWITQLNIIVIITLNVFGDLKKWNLSKMYW
jgi:hypothetical protein